jgi:hypothetical protein
MIPSIYIKDKLEASSIGVFGTDLFVGDEPTSPHDSVTVLDAGATQVDNNMNFNYSGRMVSVIVRNKSYKTAHDLADSIVEALNKTIYEEYVYEGTTFHIVGILHFSGPVLLGKDKEQRSKFSLNFEVTYQKLT